MSTASLIARFEKNIRSLQDQLSKIPNTVENSKKRAVLQDKIQATQMQKMRNEQVLMHDQKEADKKRIKKIRAAAAAGVSGGGIKSPDETARGRMTLLKKKM